MIDFFKIFLIVATISILATIMVMLVKIERHQQFIESYFSDSEKVIINNP